MSEKKHLVVRNGDVLKTLPSFRTVQTSVRVSGCSSRPERLRMVVCKLLFFVVCLVSCYERHALDRPLMSKA